MTTLLDSVLTYLEYSIWADRQWVKFGKEKALEQHQGAQFVAEMEKWLRHNLGCYRGWYSTLTGKEIEAEGDWDAQLDQILAAWKAHLPNEDFSRMVEWHRRSTGEMASLSAWTITMHVSNHAGYHRGQIRQLASQYGLTDWPDTDMVFFPAQVPTR